jgi:16S rRNA (adenine1518-N6/adenine1519-N6)-dimethyltransferase
VNVGEIRETLRRHGLAAHRARGQNFLADEAMADRLVLHAGVSSGDAVIEIGPGLGALTRALARVAGRVVAVEVDAGLVRALRADGALPAHVEVVHADALALDLAALARRLAREVGASAAAGDAAGAVRVIGNLPYAVSSPLLRRILAARADLTDWSVMVQREVAARIAARPDTRDYGSLTVLHALTTTVGRGVDVPPHCFHPAPRVCSRFLRLTPLASGPDVPDEAELEAIERVARAAFGQRRKTLANALRAGLAPALTPERVGAALAALGIDPKARAETIAPATFRALAAELA